MIKLPTHMQILVFVSVVVSRSRSCYAGGHASIQEPETTAFLHDSPVYFLLFVSVFFEKGGGPRAKSLSKETSSPNSFPGKRPLHIFMYVSLILMILHFIRHFS